MGFIGLIAFVMFIINLFLQAFSFRREMIEPFQKCLIITLIGWLISWTILGFVESSFSLSMRSNSNMILLLTVLLLNKTQV
jgi:hypothetical protein